MSLCITDLVKSLIKKEKLKKNIHFRPQSIKLYHYMKYEENIMMFLLYSYISYVLCHIYIFHFYIINDCVNKTSQKHVCLLNIHRMSKRHQSHQHFLNYLLQSSLECPLLTPFKVTLWFKITSPLFYNSFLIIVPVLCPTQLIFILNTTISSGSF